MVHIYNYIIRKGGGGREENQSGERDKQIKYKKIGKQHSILIDD